MDIMNGDYAAPHFPCKLWDAGFMRVMQISTESRLQGRAYNLWFFQGGLISMEKYEEILNERFGKDSIMALATVDENGMPWVRSIDAVFWDGSFYTITYALSNKMQHINNNANVAIGGEWFSGHAVGESLGHIRLTENAFIADMLRKAFAAWYDNGHTNEDNPNTIILKLKLVDGILFCDGMKYEF